MSRGWLLRPPRTRRRSACPGLSRIGWRRRACRCRAAAPARRRSRSSRSSEPSARAMPIGDRGRRPVGVAGREGRLGVDHRGERLGDPVEPGVVGATSTRSAGSHAATSGSPARPQKAGRASGARGTRRPARDRTSGRGARAPSAQAAAAPPAAMEDLDRLRQAGDARRAAGSRRRAARRGWPRPSQCSSRLADRLGGVRGEPEHRRDLGAAVAARLMSAGSPRPRAPIARRPIEHAPGASEARAARPVAQRPARTPRLRPRPVDALRDRAWLAVVGAEQRRHRAPSSPSSRRP